MSENRAIEVLIAQLTDGDPGNPDAQWQAAEALGGAANPTDRPRAVAALIDALANSQPHALTRSHIVEALGRLGDSSAAPALVGALSDPYRLVRAYAADALGRLGDPPQVVEALAPLLSADPFYGVRAEAAASLREAAQRDSALLERVRALLRDQRAAEIASRAPGGERVIAEIDRALALLT
jgi:HEAT repeat protein